MIYRVLAFLAILSPALSSVSCRQDCQHSAIPTSTRTPRKSTGDLRAVRGEIIRPSVPQLQQHRHTSHNGESPHQHSNGPNLGVTCWVIPGTSVALPGAWGRRQYMRHVRQGHFHVPPGRKLGRRHSSLSMKVKSRSKKGGRVATGGGSTVAMGSRQRQKNASNKALYIDVENLDSDAWRYDLITKIPVHIKEKKYPLFHQACYESIVRSPSHKPLKFYSVWQLPYAGSDPR